MVGFDINAIQTPIIFIDEKLLIKNLENTEECIRESGRATSCLHKGFFNV
jgi:hypothetical protein